MWGGRLWRTVGHKKWKSKLQGTFRDDWKNLSTQWVSDGTRMHRATILEHLTNCSCGQCRLSWGLRGRVQTGIHYSLLKAQERESNVCEMLTMMYYSLKFSIDLQYFIFIDWLCNLGWLEIHYVTQVGLELTVLLPQFLECWNYRQASYNNQMRGWRDGPVVRALAALKEDLSWVLSTQVPRDLMPSSAFFRHQAWNWCTYIHACAKHSYT